MNPRLRLAAQGARANAWITYTPSSGTGEQAARGLSYEIYGPHGAAILAEISSDNLYDADIRAILRK